MNTILTLVLALSLSAPDFTVRETGEAAVRAFGDRATVDLLARTAECPEARARLQRVRAALIVRDLDALARGRYPSAEALGWPCVSSYEYALLQWMGLGELHREPCRWVEHEEYGYCTPVYPSDEEQRSRTRAGLLLYVSRTGDWAYARKVLR